MKSSMKILFIGFLLFQSCNLDECSEISCFTPPNAFGFELVDKATGENLFTNGTFQSEQIQIQNLNGSETIGFTFIDENELNIIQLNPIGWETGVTSLSLSVGDQEIFELYVDAERLEEDCCSFTQYNEVRIDNAEYENDPTTGIIRILVE